MTLLSAYDLSNKLGITDRAARKVLCLGSEGKLWRGHHLPVVQLTGQRGGRSGATWGLRVDLCAPELLAALGLSRNLPAIQAANLPLQRPRDKAVSEARDKLDLIVPAMKARKGTRERAEAIAKIVAMSPHKIGDTWQRVAERTVRQWIKAAETKTADLIPSSRKDAGQRRVLITRRWDDACGLDEATKQSIAAELERKARGLILKGTSERETARLITHLLFRLSTDAGASLSLADCKVNRKFTGRFVTEMKVAHDYLYDHKRFADRHEYHVRRRLEATPMETLLCDVHTVDLTISDALASNLGAMREAAYSAGLAGQDKVRLWLIGWMDGASGYLWATPVLTGPGQAITQQDVALSLYSVVTCPFGGMPRKFLIDNGSEYKFLKECVLRFAKLSGLGNLGVITCAPHHPEGKARLEGAFNILERRFISALKGYNGGNILKPRLRARGKAVAAYDHGAERLIEDVSRCVAHYNGTDQHGDLAGLSPKAMLQEKAAETGWKAQIPDAEMFDLIFSREEARDIRQSTVTIGKNRYSGPVLAELIGQKQVPLLVPYRDPNGPVILFKDGIIHKLHCETYGLADPDGAKARAVAVAGQKDVIARSIAKADAMVDRMELQADAADLSPIVVGAPDQWSMGAIDKAGFLTAPITAEEARRRQDEEARQLINEILPPKGQVRRGAAGATANPSSAT